MSDASFNTVQLHAWLDCIGRGDEHAWDELIRAVQGRTERLARAMLRNYPNVRRLADTGDVLQGTLVRLTNTLRQLRPASTRDYMNLVAVHVRRELLDLARRCAVRQRAELSLGAPDPLSRSTDDLDRWVAFHEAVERLPVEEREVVGLIFYHGWTHEDVAALFSVTDRTVRRWWKSACQTLAAKLGGPLPVD